MRSGSSSACSSIDFGKGGGDDPGCLATQCFFSPSIKAVRWCIRSRGFTRQEHLQRYLLSMVRRNFRRLTILQSLSTLKLFLAFLRDTGKDRLEQVSRRDLEAFVEREQDGGLKLSSVKTKLDRVHAFLHFFGLFPHLLNLFRFISAFCKLSPSSVSRRITRNSQYKILWKVLQNGLLLRPIRLKTTIV